MSNNVLPEEERKKYLNHIDKLQEENAFMKKVLKHVFPEKSEAYYLCGEQGDKDEFGLPEYVIICPAFGKQELMRYQRVEYESDTSN